MKQFLSTLILALLLAGCAKATPAGPTTLTVMTHDSFAVSEDVKTEFETANNVTLQFLKSGDAGYHCA